jgi:hypothetical protein
MADRAGRGTPVSLTECLASSFKYAIIAAFASGICGFLHSLPFLHAIPSGASLAAAARGIASFQGLEGYGTASWIDRIAGRLWQSGGASRLAAGEWLAAFAAWTVAAFLMLVVILGFLRLLDDGRTRKIVFSSAIILILATCIPRLAGTIVRRDNRILDLELVIPVELANHLRASDQARIFANPSALVNLLLLAPRSTESVSMTIGSLFNPERWREGFAARWFIVLLPLAGEGRFEHLWLPRIGIWPPSQI